MKIRVDEVAGRHAACDVSTRNVLKHFFTTLRVSGDAFTICDHPGCRRRHVEAYHDASRQASEYKTIYVWVTLRKEVPRTFIRAKATCRQQFANCFQLYRPTFLLRCVCVLKFTRWDIVIFSINLKEFRSWSSCCMKHIVFNLYSAPNTSSLVGNPLIGQTSTEKPSYQLLYLYFQPHTYNTIKWTFRISHFQTHSSFSVGNVAMCLSSKDIINEV